MLRSPAPVSSALLESVRNLALILALGSTAYAQVSDFCYTTNNDRFWRQMSTNRSYPDASSALSFDNLILPIVIDNSEMILTVDFMAGSGSTLPIMLIPPPPNLTNELIMNGTFNPATQSLFVFVTPPVFISAGTPILQRIVVAGGAPPAGMLNGAIATVEEEVTNNFTNVEFISDDLSVSTFPQVYITEFMSDPFGPGGGVDANADGLIPTEFDQSDDEYIEIVNGTDAPVNLDGWTIEDGTGTRHEFAPGTTLDEGQAIVVFGGGCFDYSPQAVVTASTGALGLDNDGDTITLRDDMGVVVDSATFVGGGPADGDGESASRDPEIPNAPFMRSSTFSPFIATPLFDNDGILYTSGTIPALIYPGTGSDYCLRTSVNGGGLTDGSGNDRKVIVPGDFIVTSFDSPLGTFDGDVILLVATVLDHTGGAVVPEVDFNPLVLPGLYFDFVSSVVLDTSTSFGPAVVPITFSFNWTAAFLTMDFVLQGVTTVMNAPNGFFVTTNGHVFEVL